MGVEHAFLKGGNAWVGLTLFIVLLFLVFGVSFGAW